MRCIARKPSASADRISKSDSSAAGDLTRTFSTRKIGCINPTPTACLLGADLPTMTGTGPGVAPTFVVWAVKDPTSGNLDRIQIIKGWTKSGQSFEKVYDVGWAGDRKPDKWSGGVP